MFDDDEVLLMKCYSVIHLMGRCHQPIIRFTKTYTSHDTQINFSSVIHACVYVQSKMMTSFPTKAYSLIEKDLLPLSREIHHYEEEPERS